MDQSRLPTLDGTRVRLRWLDDRDLSALYEIFSSPAVTRYWGSPPLETTVDAEHLLASIREHFLSKTLIQWGITLKGDDVVIGTCTLANLEPSHRRCELGFALHPSAWGRGLGQEAVDRVLLYAFHELGMYRIEADVDPRNSRSIRLVERAGFRREGLLRQRYQVNGEIQDSLIFGLLRPEFEQRSASLTQ